MIYHLFALFVEVGWRLVVVLLLFCFCFIFCGLLYSAYMKICANKVIKECGLSDLNIINDVSRYRLSYNPIEFRWEAYTTTLTDSGVFRCLYLCDVSSSKSLQTTLLHLNSRIRHNYLHDVRPYRRVVEIDDVFNTQCLGCKYYTGESNLLCAVDPISANEGKKCNHYEQ